MALHPRLRFRGTTLDNLIKLSTTKSLQKTPLYAWFDNARCARPFRSKLPSNWVCQARFLACAHGLRITFQKTHFFRDVCWTRFLTEYSEKCRNYTSCGPSRYKPLLSIFHCNLGQACNLLAARTEWKNGPYSILHTTPLPPSPWTVPFFYSFLPS